MNAVSDKLSETICLLDDDPSVVKSLCRLLCSDGWDVECFCDPVAFLRFAEANHPRLVVIDIWMPVMDGLQVQSQLRTISPATRIVVLTSRDDPSVRAKAMDAGARAFFLKPVNTDEFLAGVKSAACDN